jgi:hypothetical protein
MSANATFYKLFDHQAMSDSMQYLAMNGCLTSGGTAIKAGGSAVAKHANTITFKINGKFYSKSTGDLTIPATAIPAGYKALVSWYLDSAGTATSVMSTPVLIAASTPVLPDFADTLVCIGAVLISNGTSSAFTGATTALDTAHVTTTYYNFAQAFPGMTV